MMDRRSVRRGQPQTFDLLQKRHAVELNHEGRRLYRVARVLAAPLSTMGRILKAMDRGRLTNMQPTKPMRRYQCSRHMHVIHRNIKQMTRFERVGHLISCRRRLG